MLLVTGGAGFIGANFVRDWVGARRDEVVVLDKLTYAGNPENLAGLNDGRGHTLVTGDICDRELLSALLLEHRPRAIVNFAAESHVDRSIHGPDAFVQTNLVGTFHLLEEARAYWQQLVAEERARFRFLHVSTDEVYGSLGPHDSAFTESTAYAPNSPYAATKAGSDHLVRAYFHTYGLPTLITNCGNNYGPYQFPEKLIPLTILNAVAGKPLPVYGDGQNVRDWLYVGDHCAAIRSVLEEGLQGHAYNIGGRSERRNIDVVRTICAVLDELHPGSALVPHVKLITFVTDRPGHDRRYAMECAKIESQLGWRAAESFESGIRRTVQWYLDNPAWVRRVTDGDYRRWMELNYRGRTGASG
jgi:dTDP-glucose 4,6-dehydratase